MALAQLVIEVIGDTAKYQSASDKVEYLAKKSAATVDATFESLKSKALETGAAILAGFAIDKLWEKFKGATEATAALQELSEKTGASIGALSSLSAISSVTGVAQDALAAALQKMGKNAAEASAGTGKAVTAYRALGISANEIKNSSPDQIFLKTAVSLDQYKDGIQKTALLQAIFGKGAAEIVPILKMLAEQGEYNATTTKEQGEAALQYANNVRTLSLQWTNFWRVISTQIVPVLNAVTVAFRDLSTEGGIAGDMAHGLADDNGLRTFAEDAAEALALLMGGIQRAGLGIKALYDTGKAWVTITPLWVTGSAAINTVFKDGTTFAQNFAEAVEGGVDNIVKAGDAWGELAAKNPFDAYDKVRSAIDKSHVAKPEKEKNDLNYTGTADDATLKAQMERRVKIIQSGLNLELQIYTSREQMLQRFYSEDYISVTDYYNAKAEAIKGGVSASLAAYDKEIAALKAYKLSINNVKEKLEAKQSIDALVADKTKAITDAQSKLTSVELDRAKALESYGDKVLKLMNDLDALSGSSSKNAGALFDAAHRNDTRQFTATGDTGSLTALSQIKDATVATAQLNDESKQADYLNKQLALSEGRINLARTTGAISELQSLAQIDTARKATIPQLELIYEKMRAIADGPGGTKEQILAAEDFKLKIDDLAASSNQLGKTFDDVFANGLSGFLTNAVSGTKTLSAAFLDMANSITAAITKIAAQQIATNLFGSASGAGGGIGSIFAGIFGGARANGGAVSGNTPYLVGEKGPELFTPSSNGSISNASQMGGMTVVQNFTVPANASFQSQNQIAAQAYTGAQRAYRRNS